MTQDKSSPAPNPMPVALPADASASPTYRITLPEFEGPLNLLLHLCQTHEIDILNISIDFIAQKYIEYLELMEDMAVEIAADYLVMAAHLAYLKSRELVPSPEPLEASEDGETPLDPREELIRRLLEYQKYKHAAENLGNRPIEGRNVFVRGAVLQADGEAGLAEHSVWKLIEHWAATLRKAKPEYTHDVVMDRMSISDRINQIVDLLEAGKGMLRFEDLVGPNLAPAELRHKVVVSLLAVLELARLGVVRILQEEATGTFFLAQVEGAAMEDARHLNVTSAKQPESQQKSAEGEADVSEATQASVAVSTAANARVSGAAFAVTDTELPTDRELTTDEILADLEMAAAEVSADDVAPEAEIPSDTMADASDLPEDVPADEIPNDEIPDDDATPATVEPSLNEASAPTTDGPDTLMEAAAEIPEATPAAVEFDAPENATETTSEPAAETTSEAAAETTSEAAAETTSEAAAETTSEPAAETTSEPAAETTSEPAADAPSLGSAVEVSDMPPEETAGQESAAEALGEAAVSAPELVADSPPESAEAAATATLETPVDSPIAAAALGENGPDDNIQPLDPTSENATSDDPREPVELLPKKR